MELTVLVVIDNQQRKTINDLRKAARAASTDTVGLVLTFVHDQLAPLQAMANGGERPFAIVVTDQVAPLPGQGRLAATDNTVRVLCNTIGYEGIVAAITESPKVGATMIVAGCVASYTRKPGQFETMFALIIGSHAP